MKHFKFLGLLVTTAVAMMAFAASAMATSVTTTTGGAATTPTIHAVNEGGHITIANPIANISCASTFEGPITQHGSGIPADGVVNTLLFTGCTNSWHVTAVSNGFNYGTFNIRHTSGHNGTVESSAMRIDATRFGVTCVYDTLNTPLGTFTGGNPGTLHTEGSIPLNSALSSILCGANPSKSQWEGSYVTTSELYVGA